MDLLFSWVGELCSAVGAGPRARRSHGGSGSQQTWQDSSSALAASELCGHYLSQPTKPGPRRRIFPQRGTNLFAPSLLMELVGPSLSPNTIPVSQPGHPGYPVTAFVADKEQVPRQTLSSRVLHFSQVNPVWILH